MSGEWEHPSVTVEGVTLRHNAANWSVKTNRHTNTDGSAWGWIEGPAEHACWSNNQRFDCDAARQIVMQHNQWLVDQEPILLRLMRADIRRQKALAEAQIATEKAHTARLEHRQAEDEFQRLLVLSCTQSPVPSTRPDDVSTAATGGGR